MRSSPPSAAGGMGEVYRAADTALEREVAVKVLPDSFAGDPDRLARFEREAKTLAVLNHPNIAHIYGLERYGTTLALVMELVEGQTLADRKNATAASRAQSVEHRKVHLRSRRCRRRADASVVPRRRAWSRECMRGRVATVSGPEGKADASTSVIRRSRTTARGACRPSAPPSAAASSDRDRGRASR